MNKNCQKNNSIIETTSDCGVKKPEHEINAEIISVEIVGNDDTPKVEYTNPWGVVAALSLIAMIVSLFVNGVAFLFCFAIFLVSISFSADKSCDRANNPWKYKD